MVDELEVLKRKKLLEMMKKLQKKREEEQRKRMLEERRRRLLEVALTPDAYRYLESIKSSKPSVAKKIEDTVLTLLLQGYLEAKLGKIDIMALERRIEGKEPEIRVVRGGEAKSLSEVLRGGDE